MSKPPVVFVSFANNSLKPLPSLKKEGALIKQLFSPIADNQQIQFHLEDFADTDNLTDYFIQYKDRILIFHYGGHANSKSLLLNDQKANAQGIAYQLAQQKSIQLVFLNGCSTRQQVDLLLDLGIPAVIATSVPIGDKSATHFAEKFYVALITDHTLEAAFNMAAANFESKYNHRPKIYRDTGLRGEKNKELPWGLYTRNDDDILNQQMIPAKMKKNSITNNTNNTTGNGNVVLQGVNAKGNVKIEINQSSQPKDLKTQTIEKILQEFSNTLDTPFKNWISPYLFKGDTTLKMMLPNKEFSNTSKKDFLGLKLTTLLQDTAFKKALEQQLGWSKKTIKKEKNIVQDTEIETDLDIHIGDKNSKGTEPIGKKNIVIGSKIKTKGGFRLGDG